ncbi:MAG TPA: hypothetical protein VIV60_29945, partial [Polyangiaceae bacterium]
MCRASPRFVRSIALVSLLLVAAIGKIGVAAPLKSPESSAPTAALPSTQTEEEPVEPGSPRATVSEFLRLCREGNYVQAARYLDVPASQAQRSPVLARKLRAVLDRYAWIDLDTISPAAAGDLNDSLPPAYESIAQV